MPATDNGLLLRYLMGTFPQMVCNAVSMPAVCLQIACSKLVDFCVLSANGGRTTP